MSLKLAVFDLDGTLFSTKDVNYRAYKEALGELPLDYDFYCKACNGQNYRQFLPKIVPGITEDEMQRIHEAKKRAYPKYLKYAELNEELLKNFLEINALVTTASRRNAEDILSEFGLKDSFDFVITQEDVENTKPDPECFLLALSRAGVKKEETIVYEDSEPGFKAAEAAGLKYVKVEGFN